MTSEDIKKSNSIIAQYIGYEQSEVEPDYWWCNDLGLTSLKFHEDWKWLMQAIQIVQKTEQYKLQRIPYDLKTESILLSEFITKIPK
jgi:hypothetical protein